MIVYHGSDVIVDKPEIRTSAWGMDFGVGFYTTTFEEQAIERAEKIAIRNKSGAKVVSVYEFDMERAEKELTILSFDGLTNEWLDFVMLNRSLQVYPRHYDIAIGPMADDNVFRVLLLLDAGDLDRGEAKIRLKVKTTQDQILFHNEDSLAYLKFLRHEQLGG